MTKPRTEQADLARLPKALEPLTLEPRWVIWNWEQTTNKKGETKWTKVPYRAEHSSQKASNDDPDTWSKYEPALSAYKKARGDGIGYNLYDGGIGAFDIDHCRNPETGELTAAAKQLVKRANSYTEITVSGTGLRIIGRSNGGGEIHRKQCVDGFELESYRGAKRYIVITGKQLAGTPNKLANIDGVMTAVVAELDKAAGKNRPRAAAAPRRVNGQAAPLPSGATMIEDKLERIIRCGENGEYGGDRSAAEFYVIIEMLRRGYQRDAIRAVLTKRENGIAAKSLEAGDPQHYAERQIERGISKLDLDCNEKDVPFRTADNIRIALVKLGVVLRYDLFAERALIENLPGFGPALSDAAATRLWMLMDQRFKLQPIKDMLADVLTDTARLNAFHPVRDYLDALQWDGEPRLDTWLIDYGHAPDTDYVRAVGALTLIAAVRRVRQPGCKFDEMLVLEGVQGSERSSILATLAVKPDWFSDDLPLNADSKVVIERLSGHWIVEAAELSGMRRADIEHVKAFLSRQRDKARMAYGRFPVEAPRQCIIVGTTNDAAYLRDLTGNRRFWPVPTSHWDLRQLKRDRDQLWAEAAAREAKGESIRLARELWPKAKKMQEKRTVIDPFQEVLMQHLNDKYGKIRATDVWTIIGLPAGQRTQVHNERLGNALRAMGWNRLKQRFGHGPEWGYLRDRPDQGIPVIRDHVRVYLNSDKTLDVWVEKARPMPENASLSPPRGGRYAEGRDT